ncbi:MAG: type II toxin-antitoxin system HicA family toxin [Pseudomonadota bacterium]|nr:type II toxin-antitoxin system HicA family toxin [Pseudomonadota bacterium]
MRARLLREGWAAVPSRGPHEKFRRADRGVSVIVPRGRGDLPTGTARSIARAAGWI